jgi:hypothetical protein
MTKEEAEGVLAPGSKIQYWDGRIATVTSPLNVDNEFAIKFDAEPSPQPTYYIKSDDFLRAKQL